MAYFFQEDSWILDSYASNKRRIEYDSIFTSYSSAPSEEKISSLSTQSVP